MEHLLNRFNSAQEAFEKIYDFINSNGIKYDNTKALFNVGFFIDNPIQRDINTPKRNWKKDYAEYEWDWYLSGNRSVSEIKKIAKIWDKMHNGDDLVNSNYGYQWLRNNQIQYIIDELNKNKHSRRAVISIYDGKEHSKYEYDTPCTLSIGFNVIDNRLNMSVYMRSNDVWFGFCNDQYCFSKLLELIANKLQLEVGWYYHHATNMHIYERHFDKL
jgi:thymidylate synthase